MSFRCRQKLLVPPSGVVLSVELSTLEDGSMVNSAVDQGKKVLPEAELFDINDQLKAGINLEEVSSKVISKRHVSNPQKVVDSLMAQDNKQVSQDFKQTNESSKSSEGDKE